MICYTEEYRHLYQEDSLQEYLLLRQIFQVLRLISIQSGLKVKGYINVYSVS